MKVHRFVSMREGVWLPKITPEGPYGSFLHQYCSECGLIRVPGDERGKSIGFFLNITGQLRGNVTQVQRHLITQKLKDMPLFTDHEGSYFHIQVREYARIVAKIAPHVSQEMVEALCRNTELARRRKQKKRDVTKNPPG